VQTSLQGLEANHVNRDLNDELHDHDRGLAFDLSTLLSRRGALRMLAGAGLATLAGCATGSGGSSAASATSGAASSTSTGSDSAACEEIPEETAGPYPGDGSNGPNVLTQSGIVRSDIRSSFGSASGTAEGIPLLINLTILDLANDCAPNAGAAVYLWHCDRDGLYSLYSPGVTDQNYLRGVQEASSDGKVTFKSIFPAAYSGRWPHVHFEVYPSLTAATSASSPTATSQLAFPEDACKLVYATDGYSQSVRNLAQTSLESDNVFGDGSSQQLAKVTGNVTSGFTADLTVPV
jgi:protocatechuate 3,4-dioxygenase beta subunit